MLMFRGMLRGSRCIALFLDDLVVVELRLLWRDIECVRVLVDLSSASGWLLGAGSGHDLEKAPMRACCLILA